MPGDPHEHRNPAYLEQKNARIEAKTLLHRRKSVRARKQHKSTLPGKCQTQKGAPPIDTADRQQYNAPKEDTVEDNEGNNMEDAEQQGSREQRKRSPGAEGKTKQCSSHQRNAPPPELSETDKEIMQKFTTKMAEFMPWKRSKENLVALYFRRLQNIDLANIEDAAQELCQNQRSAIHPSLANQSWKF